MPRLIRLFLVAAATWFLALPALAQPAQVPVVLNTSGQPIPAQAHICVDLSGAYVPCGTPGAATETTLQEIADNTADTVTELQTPATSLPPLSPTNDTTLGIAPTSSTSAEACHVMKASAGNLYSTSGYIGAAGFIMVFNATSAPADGAVTPTTWAYAPAAGSWSIDYGAIPQAMSTGITVCASSTGPLTKTAYSTNTVFAARVK